MAEFIFKQTEPQLWTVGHYAPEGKFVPESDHGSDLEAAKRVRFLNGGPVTELPGQGFVPVMPLRDYFAAAAIPFFCNPAALKNTADTFDKTCLETVAIGCYEIADAMLAARANKEPTTDE